MLSLQCAFASLLHSSLYEREAMLLDPVDGPVLASLLGTHLSSSTHHNMMSGVDENVLHHYRLSDANKVLVRCINITDGYNFFFYNSYIVVISIHVQG